ncbi:MAG: LacI family DNA-binding transcriptional regulator [Cohaesibacteraceae bacterium]
MATIYDVAKAANVSPKTVCRAINGDAPVGKKTRDKVEAAIASLGYVPSLAARTMRSNRSGLVGLITGAISLAPDSSEFGGLPDLIIVQRVQRVLEDNGMSLLISDTGGKQERVADLMRTFTEHRVEGMLYVGDYHKRVDLPPFPDGTKLVLANCYDDAGTPCVLPHDRLCQKMLVEALIAKGHRRIAYLSLSNDIDATRLRTEGYRDALEAAGIAVDPGIVIPADTRMSDPQAEVQLLWDAIERIMADDHPPTAICFGNDRIALRAYGILRSRGLRVPDDISVAGFDNHRLIAETLYPQLTTVELPYAAMGVRAAHMLLSLIKGEEAPSEPQLVSGPVCWRDSVLPRPASVTNINDIASLGRKSS